MEYSKKGQNNLIVITILNNIIIYYKTFRLFIINYMNSISHKPFHNMSHSLECQTNLFGSK